MTLNAERQNNRVAYFDFLRFVSSLAVVIVHVAAQNWNTVTIGSKTWHYFNFLDSVTRWGAPVFFMVSGALFLEGNRTIGQIVRKNISRLAAVFIFWSGIYALVYYAMGIYALDLAIWRFCVGNYHMWFLWALIALYLAVPVLRKIAESESATRYFLLLAFVFNSVLPTVNGLVSYFSDTGGALMSEILESAHFDFPMGYVFYFLCGYYLNQKELDKQARTWIYLFGVAGAMLTFLGTAVLSVKRGMGVGLFYNDWSVGTVGMSMAVFVLGKYAVKQIPGWIKYVSGLSFGVYLLHPLIQDLLKNIANIDTLAFHPLAATPLLVLLVMVISMFITALIKCIPVINRYLV